MSSRPLHSADSFEVLSAAEIQSAIMDSATPPPLTGYEDKRRGGGERMVVGREIASSLVSSARPVLDELFGGNPNARSIAVPISPNVRSAVRRQQSAGAPAVDLTRSTLVSTGSPFASYTTTGMPTTATADHAAAVYSASVPRQAWAAKETPSSDAPRLITSAAQVSDRRSSLERGSAASLSQAAHPQSHLQVIASHADHPLSPSSQPAPSPGEMSWPYHHPIAYRPSSRGSDHGSAHMASSISEEDPAMDSGIAASSGSSAQQQRPASASPRLVNERHYQQQPQQPADPGTSLNSSTGYPYDNPPSELPSRHAYHVPRSQSTSRMSGSLRSMADGASGGSEAASLHRGRRQSHQTMSTSSSSSSIASMSTVASGMYTVPYSNFVAASITPPVAQHRTGSSSGGGERSRSASPARDFVRYYLKSAAAPAATPERGTQKLKAMTSTVVQSIRTNVTTAAAMANSVSSNLGGSTADSIAGSLSRSRRPSTSSSTQFENPLDATVDMYHPLHAGGSSSSAASTSSAAPSARLVSSTAAMPRDRVVSDDWHNRTDSLVLSMDMLLKDTMSLVGEIRSGLDEAEASEIDFAVRLTSLRTNLHQLVEWELGSTQSTVSYINTALRRIPLDAVEAAMQTSPATVATAGPAEPVTEQAAAPEQAIAPEQPPAPPLVKELEPSAAASETAVADPAPTTDPVAPVPARPSDSAPAPTASVDESVQ
ncbi:hypothetical protein H9P43_004636 [Blastocladiella emersonii ATCC 22665]|nr:hypothetical protein H9P43_004636 [Blastocladiella emersonii ATCC 22665]